MEYLEFERILSAKRMQRYKDAVNGDTRKAMALYRYNLRLSQEMFTIVSCFEVALRNAIDSLLVPSLGENWLKDSVQVNGIFTNGRMNETRKIIEKAYNRLDRQGIYSHSKLIAEMKFGVWKYIVFFSTVSCDRAMFVKGISKQTSFIGSCSIQQCLHIQ